MMIRINLFPGQRSAQARTVRRQYREIVAGVGVLVLMMMACGIGTLMMGQIIAQARQENHSRTAELSLLTQKTKDSHVVRTTYNHLQAYQRLIRHLSEDQRLPIQILDEMSRRVDQYPLWLLRLHVEDQSVIIEGKALSKKIIVQFAENLKDAALFQLVTINEMRAAHQGESHRVLFTIQIRLTQGFSDASSTA